MTHRERFLATVLGRPRDRAPYWLYWWIWSATWERWKGEGLPREFKSFADVRAHFGADETPRIIPVRLGPVPDLSAAVSEDAESVTRLDSWGIKHRNLRGNEGMPEFLAWPVSSRDDWRRYRDRHLDPADPARLAGNWIEQGKAWNAADLPVQLGAFPDCGIFGTLRWLLGDEECLLAFCAEPD